MLSYMITVLKSSFVQHKLTILRNKKTSNTVFRQTMNEASYLIAAEVLKYIAFKKVTIETPLKKTQGVTIAQPIILVPILRAGLGLLEGFTKFLPDAEKGHIGLYRDEQTYEPVEYLFKLPRTKNKKIIILDPMLATGNSSIAAINLIKNKGVKSLRSNFTGDLYCRVHVETPINITKEQEELLRQLDNSFRTSKSTHIPKENRWVDKIKEFFE